MKKQILAPSILALFVASAAHAGATFDTAAGTLNLGADVEFDYTTQSGEDYSESGDADIDLTSTGRLLLDVNGEKVLDNGNFAGFKLNPTWGQNGKAGADDIWIKFGQKDNWAIQAGHFEA
ncbi:MAG TPA: carbohydrate porin, partial [Psychromonas sp.]